MSYNEEGYVYRKDGSVLINQFELNNSYEVDTYVEGQLEIANAASDQEVDFGMNAEYVRLSTDGKLTVKVDIAGTPGTDAVPCNSQLVLSGDSTDYIEKVLVSNASGSTVTLEYIAGV